MQSPVDFKVERINDIDVIYVTGPINAMHSPKLRELIAQSFESAQGVVVDLADVNYMDSSGLATLVEGYQRSESEGKKFVLSRMFHERVQHLMEITRLGDLFQQYDSVEEAVASVS